MKRLALLGLAALALSACEKKASPPSVEAQARAVQVVTVAPRALTGVLAASGPLEAREEAAVSAEVTGFRVARVNVEEGAFVRRGQVLAQLDGTLLASQIDQQAALASQAAIQAERAEAEAARVKDLDGTGALSQEQLDGRRFAARAARATANAQAASLKDLKTRQSKLAVTAPVGGLVLERTVRPGDLSAGGSTPWFRLARDGLVEMAAQLSEADLTRVKVGQRATVVLPDGGQVPGVVRLVSPSIDPNSRLGEARISLPVRPDVRAGGFARANFADAASQVLAVPESAVRYDADGASVMVVDSGNKVRQAPVKTGQRGGGYVELVTGPPAGSWVLQKAAALVLPGDVVKPVQVQLK